MNLTISSRKALVVLLCMIACLSIGNAISLWLKFGLGHDYVYGLVPLFDLNEEMNVPTFFASVIILMAGGILAGIAEMNRRSGKPYGSWYGLAAIFTFLAIDENAGIHELLQQPGTEMVNATGLLYQAWIVPYGIILLVFCAFYIRFLLALPRTSMVLFAVSGAIFITGAVGMEAIGSSFLEDRGAGLGYHILTTIEETLELLGITLFVYALLAHIESELPTFTVSFGKPSNRRTAARGLEALVPGRST